MNTGTKASLCVLAAILIVWLNYAVAAGAR
jgi:hypothetical protein